MDATSGRVKIGDLGLAREFVADLPLTVIGTPEFMAPDFYNEYYTEKVDIWGFGMSVIEMITGKVPYSEKTPVQIYKAVSSGTLPSELDTITDTELRNFILLCLKEDPNERPSATELLEHEFLAGKPVSFSDEIPQIPISAPKQSTNNEETSSIDSKPIDDNNNTSSDKKSSLIQDLDVTVIEEEKVKPQERHAFLVKENCSCNIISKTELEIKLEVNDTGTVEQIEFSLDVTEDIDAIILEMVQELNLPSNMYDALRNQVEEFIKSSAEVQQHFQ